MKAEYINRLGLARLKAIFAQGGLAVLNIRVDPGRNLTHAVLATGYDEAKQKILVEDPADQISVISYEFLLRIWSAHLSQPRGQSYQSAFVVHPKD